MSINMEDDVAASDTSIERLAQLMQQHADAVAAMDELQAKLDEKKEELRILMELTIPTFFEESGVQEVTMPTGEQVMVEDKVYPNIAAERFHEARAWLKKNKLDDIIKNQTKVDFGRGEEKLAEALEAFLKKSKIESFSSKAFIHPQTLAAFVRERLAKGLELPDAIAVNPLRIAVIKKPKTKRR